MVTDSATEDGHPPDLSYTHTRLLVDEYAACVRFYRDVLGLEVTFGDEESGYADLGTGATTIALFDADEMAATLGTDRATGGDDVALVFAVESVDEAHDRLAAETTFVTEPRDRPAWGIRVAHLRDPDGTLIELTEPLDD